MADIRDAADLERFIGEWEVTVDLPGASGVASRTTFGVSRQIRANARVDSALSGS